MMLLLTRMSSQDNQDAATNVLSIITVVVRYCSYHADMQTLFDVSIVSKQLDFQFQYQFCLPLTFTLTLTEANVDQEFSGETFLSNTATKHPSMHLHTILSTANKTIDEMMLLLGTRNPGNRGYQHIFLFKLNLKYHIYIELSSILFPFKSIFPIYVLHLHYIHIQPHL